MRVKFKYLLLLFCGILLFNINDVLAQKRTQWTDTLEHTAARGKKVVLCGDESFFTEVDQAPFLKEGGKKITFMELLQQKLDAEPAIEGNATIVVEIIVNCKGVVGSLRLLKYGDKENPAELALVKAINHAISQLPDFLPGKNEGRVVNYKVDKLKIKTANSKITLN
jgi:hypothetical protein